MPALPPIFAELNARSAFSFHRGVNHPEELVKRAAELGYPAIALTDHDGFMGSARAHAAAREFEIRAIVGVCIPWDSGTHLPVLAPDHDTYSALCQHLTTQHLERAGLDGDLLNQVGAISGGSGAGGIALTGDREGPIARHLVRQDPASAGRALAQLMECFGRENLFVQITRHQLQDEPYLIRELVALARHFNLPLLASNSPLMAHRSDRPLADAFTCLRHHTTLDAAGRLLAPNSERHLKSPDEMRALFHEFPEALSNTIALAERCEFGLEKLGYRFPDFSDVPGQPLSIAEQSTRLRRLTYQGARKLYPGLPHQVKDQLEHELALIQRLGFPGYFLIVWEIMEFARGRQILCQGRGSAANSAVCYCLGITKVDPIAQGLLFERFLSENRRSWPDIDIDFPSGDRREEVIQHVFKKYGRRGAAMTANVITYRPRSAFREMSKVLGFPESIADRFSEICRAHSHRAENPDPNSPENAEQPNVGPPPSGATNPKKKTGSPEPQTPKITNNPIPNNLITNNLIPEDHPRLPALLHLFESVLGLPRHLGQHSGGMIICDRGLDQIVPLQPATMAGRSIVQWDKDDCEDLGIVKVDLLGLGMLAAMQDALQLCEDQGYPVDLAQIPKDDPATFELMTRADTIGTFQVESRAQMATLPIMQPKTFYDVAVEVAIIRPGPIVGDLVHPYLNRRTGREPIDYIHPDFEPVLKRTLGVPLFQEQVLRMAMIIADFDGSEADELRRALGFKRNDSRMNAVTAKLTSRMNAKGISNEVQEKVIKSIGSFALYGFPESHAISFALIAYASCWLKVHRPAEFFCGLINNQPMGFYSVNTLIQDARRHGIRIRPISLSRSEALTTLADQNSLLLGFYRLKGLSTSTLNRLLEARKNSPFISLHDFLERVAPNKKERRLLAQAGVLNELPETPHRRQALWQAELPLSTDLFTPLTNDSVTDNPITNTPMTLNECLSADYQTQGHSTGPHPMKLWRKSIRGSGVSHVSPPKQPKHEMQKIPLHPVPHKFLGTQRPNQVFHNKLPHWRSDHLTYAITFRLADSLPASTIQQYVSQKQELQERLQSTTNLKQKAELTTQLENHFHCSIEEHLHRGQGDCQLAIPACAQIFLETLKYHAEKSFHLHAFCLMPNHTHLLLSSVTDLDKTLRSLKSYSAKQINRHLKRKGPLWQSESYDHLIRDGDDYSNQKQYIERHATRWNSSMMADVRDARATIEPNLQDGPHSPPPLIRASDFSQHPHGARVSIAGMAICRQRPGTAKGHCFISLEDETGIANLFVPRETFQANKLLISTEPFLLVHGKMQSGEGGTHTLFVEHLEPLPSAATLPNAKSHDFH